MADFTGYFFNSLDIEYTVRYTEGETERNDLKWRKEWTIGRRY